VKFYHNIIKQGVRFMREAAVNVIDKFIVDCSVEREQLIKEMVAGLIARNIKKYLEISVERPR